MKKKFYESRTFWLATVQCAIAVLGIILSHNPAIQQVSAVLIIKSILDITLRSLTTMPVEVQSLPFTNE